MLSCLSRCNKNKTSKLLDKTLYRACKVGTDFMRIKNNDVTFCERKVY